MVFVVSPTTRLPTSDRWLLHVRLLEVILLVSRDRLVLHYRSEDADVRTYRGQRQIC